MTQARLTAPHIAVVDATTTRFDGTPVAPSATLSWLPPGYDSTDVRVLEWLAAHRRSRRTRTSRSNLAA